MRLILGIAMLTTLPASNMAAAQDCYSLRSTTAITGSFRRLDSSVLFSPYSFPVRPFYMCPDPIWTLYAANVPSASSTWILAIPGSPDIHESDLRPGIYVRLTGELELKGGVLIIHIFHIEDVDMQIKGSIADWGRACADWQDGQIRKTESESRYWSNMERLPVKGTHIVGFGQECGIRFDITTPDKSIHGVTLMRPAN